MYTVGIWFVHLMNLAILAIVGVIILVYIQVKKGEYLKEAQTCIQCEILLSTGHCEFHTVKCNVSDEWVKIDNFEYKLHPTYRRWGVHPRLPFMGLRTLQVPIRKETWMKDVPDPYYREKEIPQVTAAEVDAKTNEAMAVSAAATAVEIKSQQEQLIKAIANQPDKTAVYVMLGITIIGIAIVAINSLIG